MTEVHGIKAYIWANGNSTLDVPERVTEINVCLTEFDDAEQREDIRQQLESCFSSIWDDKAKVLFTDEIEI